MGWRRVRAAATAGVLVVLLALPALAGCSADGGRQPAPAWTQAPPPRVLVFGDSYTAGHGATPLTAGYAYQLGGVLGWDVTVDGVGGSGYLAKGHHDEGGYASRLAKAPPGPFDLVVLQGGSNDEQQRLDRLEPAVDAAVTAATRRYPDARLVLMGPVAVYGVVSPAKAGVHDVLRSYATSHGITFMDPIDEGWFVRGEAKTLVDPATQHPSNAGYARIRDRFVIDATRLDLHTRTG